MQIQKYSTIKILGRVGFRSKIVYIQNIFIYIYIKQTNVKKNHKLLKKTSLIRLPNTHTMQT